MTMPHLDFPFHLDGRGRTAQTGDAGHVRDLIEQVLLTAPGERVMRPDFGSGLLQMVFEPGGAAVASGVQMLVQSSLQQHLAHLVTVDQVTVESIDGALIVNVDYRMPGSDSAQRAMVQIPGGTA